MSDEVSVDTAAIESSSHDFAAAAATGHALAARVRAALFPPDQPWGHDQTGKAFEKGFYGAEDGGHTRNGRPRAEAPNQPAEQIASGLEGVVNFLDDVSARLQSAADTYSAGDAAAAQTATQARDAAEG